MINSFAVLLAAAGKSSRFSLSSKKKILKKTFVRLQEKPVWVHSVEKFHQRQDVVQMIVIVSPEDQEWFQEHYVEEIHRFALTVVSGGQERVDSVQNALAAVRNNIEFIAIHDAARPCVTDEQIESVFQAAIKYGSALLASPVAGTLKQVQNNTVQTTVPRESLWEAQTPQVFRRNILTDSFHRRGSLVPTDDAQLVENAGYTVHIVPSNRWNIKITEQADLILAERILETAR